MHITICQYKIYQITSRIMKSFRNSFRRDAPSPELAKHLLYATATSNSFKIALLWLIQWTPLHRIRGTNVAVLSNVCFANSLLFLPLWRQACKISNITNVWSSNTSLNASNVLVHDLFVFQFLFLKSRFFSKQFSKVDILSPR